MNFHIVGLDLSLSGTGVARVRPHDRVPIHTRTIGSKKQPGARYPETLERIRSLTRRIVAAVREEQEEGDVVVVVIEEPFPGADMGQAHTRAGLWWLVYHIIEKEAVVVTVPIATLKRYVTGFGGGPKSDKSAMLAAMARNFPDLVLDDDNQADALGLANMASRELGFPMEPSVQRVTPAALETVRWPSGITNRKRTP